MASGYYILDALLVEADPPGTRTFFAGGAQVQERPDDTPITTSWVTSTGEMIHETEAGDWVTSGGTMLSEEVPAAPPAGFIRRFLMLLGVGS